MNYQSNNFQRFLSKAKRYIWLWVILLFCLLILFSISCSKIKGKDEYIRIGVILPISGANSVSTHDIINGIDLAADIINYKYDLDIPFASETGIKSQKKKIKIIYKDFGDNREKVNQLVDELVKFDKVDIICGCYFSNATSFASERADLYNIPFFTFNSTVPILTRKGLKNFYRTTPDDEIFTANFFEYLKEISTEYQFPKRIILVYENSLWGTGVAQAETRQAKLNGYEIVSEISYDSFRPNSFRFADQIKKAMPAIIMQASYDQDAIEWMRTYKNNDINPIAILAMNAGFTSSSFIDSLRADGNFIITRETWAKDLTNNLPLAKKINDLYRLRYHNDLNGLSARSFTGLMTVARILDQSRSLKAEDIKASTQKIKIFPDELIMPWAGVQFNEDGQNQLGRGIIVQIQNEKYSIVWPKDLATEKTVWEFPKWNKR